MISKVLTMIISNKLKMKKLITLLYLMLAAACTREPASGDGGCLTVDLGGIATTKSIIGATPAEMRVNSLMLFVYDSDGMLDLAHSCSADEISAKQAVMEVKTGSKTIYALANFRGDPLAAANATATSTELAQVPFLLGDNLTDGLLMTASASAMVVSGSGGSAMLQLSRPVARVALGSVSNRLPSPYGSVRVLRAFLCNVVGNQNVAGTAPASVWYNRNATSDNVAGHVIGTGGYAAQEASLTYVELNEDVALNAEHTFSNKFFYAFPNGLTNPNNGFSSTFSPTATVLMVVVQIKNVPYYYPVPLIGALERNKDYKVDLTLIGLGNTEDQPFNKIEKANLAASVQVCDWTSGATYTESI